MNLAVLFLLFHFTLGMPILLKKSNHHRTIQVRPQSAMEFFARKMGFIDFMTNFLRGLKATLHDGIKVLFNRNNK